MILLLCALAGVLRAQEFEPDEVELSYIYAAVMGTGTYRIRDRRISMFRLPLAWSRNSQNEPIPKRTGCKWLMPLVVGYDDLSKVDSDWIGALLPDQLVTLTALPGLELAFPVRSNWTLKPFVQLGGGRDFSAEETFVVTHLGLRSLNVFDLNDRWQLQWGNALSWAAEYQLNSKNRESFGLFESGLDLRRVVPFRLSAQRTDIGAYYVFQRYLPEWNIGRAPDRRFETRDLHEFGLSIGVDQGRKLLGIPIRRVRVGYKKGGKFQGWSIGTEFPF